MALTPEQQARYDLITQLGAFNPVSLSPYQGITYSMNPSMYPTSYGFNVPQAFLDYAISPNATNQSITAMLTAARNAPEAFKQFYTQTFPEWEAQKSQWQNTELGIAGNPFNVPEPQFSMPGFETFSMPQADHGSDNKGAVIDSLKKYGFNLTPIEGDRIYGSYWAIPEQFYPYIVQPYDQNPDNGDWEYAGLFKAAMLGAIGAGLAGAGGLFGAGEAAAGSGLVDTAASPFFNTAWNAGNTAALNLGGVASAVPELNLLGAGASSLASTIPSLANALSVYGVTPIPSQAVYDAASMISTTTPWDQTKNFLKDNAGSIARTASSMFQQPAGQTLPTMPDFSMGASGGTQPTQQRSIAQQQQSQPSQLSVPQFNQMPGPQQDYGNYQPPQFMDASQGWGDPSVFQLSQSTWNPSMANALRSYNG